MFSQADLAPLLPVLVVTAAALVAMVVDWFVDEGELRPQLAVAVVGLALAGLSVVWGLVPTGLVAAREVALPGGPVVPTGLARVDGFGLYAQGVLAAVGLLVVLLGGAWMWQGGRRRAELFVLTLFATAAMMLLTVANDLVLAFLAIETFSVALYVLAGFQRDQRTSQEAALKYFVLGAFAAGFLLYGTALLYAATGTVNLDALGVFLGAHGQNLPALAFVALALLLVGLGFKVAMAPFHQWTPDVYEGAPTPVTAFMATGTKLAAFVVLFRVLWTAFPAQSAVWLPLLGGLAVFSMFVGNLAALVQSDLKRMLAFSAIAQAGYMLVAVLAGAPAGSSALLYYGLVYALMTLGAFGVLVGLGRVEPGGREQTNLSDLAGLGRRHPALAFALALFLVSLTGLPPTAGFLGKWYIFQAAVGAGQTWLAVMLVVNSVISAFYYLRPVVLMYMSEPVTEARIEVPTGAAVTVAVAAVVVALALVLSGPLLAGASSATVAGAPRAGEVGAPVFISAPSLPKTP
jgi:NADH-quinone oxidoreductase subunit N